MVLDRIMPLLQSLQLAHDAPAALPQQALPRELLQKPVRVLAQAAPSRRVSPSPVSQGRVGRADLSRQSSASTIPGVARVRAPRPASSWSSVICSAAARRFAACPFARRWSQRSDQSSAPLTQVAMPERIGRIARSSAIVARWGGADAGAGAGGGAAGRWTGERANYFAGNGARTAWPRPMGGVRAPQGEVDEWSEETWGARCCASLENALRTASAVWVESRKELRRQDSMRVS